MPSPTTALQIIEDALGLTNAVGVDQTLVADEISDSLRRLNDLIENWSTQSLAVYGQANQTFNTIANQGTYTIGTGGDWNTTRPVRIDSAYTVYQTVSFPVVEITQEEYNAIPYKALTQEFPTQYLYVNDYPLGLITLFPIPSAITPVTFSIARVLTQVSAAAAAISFPPGYADAFISNLAIKLGPLFGKRMADYPDLVLAARTSLADIKRANNRPRALQADPALTARFPGSNGWRWYY